MIPHGTISGYSHHRCRCDACRKAASDYARARHKPRSVRAGKVQTHIRRLRAAGMLVKHIAAAAKLPASTINSIIYDRPRTGFVHNPVAAAILAIPVAPARQPALAARRKLQALATMGWPIRELSTRSGIGTTTLTMLRAGTRQGCPATFAAVDQLYDQLWNLDGGSNITRTIARQHGWAPPLAWDDATLDDPTAKPAHLTANATSLDDVQWRLDIGEPVTQIARTLGIQPESIHRRITRQEAA